MDADKTPEGLAPTSPLGIKQTQVELLLWKSVENKLRPYCLLALGLIGRARRFPLLFAEANWLTMRRIDFH